VRFRACDLPQDCQASEGDKPYRLEAHAFCAVGKYDRQINVTGTVPYFDLDGTVGSPGWIRRGLYEGCRLCKHYVGKLKCLGSGALMIFDPRPKEHQRFKLPNSLLEK
jgi:hypothetical protein